MPNAFADLRERHAGETIYLVGCGPSLDLALEREALDGQVCVCINRAAELVPASATRYFVAEDNETYRRWRGAPPGCVSLVKRGYLDLWDVEAPDIANAVRARVGRDVVLCSYVTMHAICEDRARVAADEILYACVGSATPGAYLAWYLGAASVVLVGVDGGAGHSRAALKRSYSKADVDERRTTPYDNLRASALRVLRVLGVPHTDFVVMGGTRCDT